MMLILVLVILGKSAAECGHKALRSRTRREDCDGPYAEIETGARISATSDGVDKVRHCARHWGAGQDVVGQQYRARARQQPAQEPSAVAGENRGDQAGAKRQFGKIRHAAR